MSKPYRHVLIATDFSEAADRAVETGAALARQFGARLTLFHAFDAGVFERAVAPTPPADLEEAMARSARERLERIAARLTDLEGVECVAVQTKGAAHAVVEHASHFDVDLCVVGTRGHTGIKRMLIGSVAEKIVRHAPCDVLALQSGEQPWPPKRILATTDFSEPSLVALTRTKELATHLHAPVTLAYVYDESIPAPADNGALFETLDQGIQRTGRALEELAKDHLGADASAVVVTGLNAAQRIAQLAKEQESGLIVVGTHGRTGIAHMLIGSVAERIVRHAPHAALVVRSR